MSVESPHLILNRFQYEALEQTYPNLIDFVRQNGYFVESLDSVVVTFTEIEALRVTSILSEHATLPWVASSRPIHASPLLEVRESPTCKGNGLFAKYDIPVGTKYFDLDEEPHILIDEKLFRQLSLVCPEFARTILHFGFYPPEIGHVILLLNDGSYMNHSDNPSGRVINNGRQAVTTRHITQGEEIFENYSLYNKCPWARLYGDMEL
jgi:hypothetical protein